MAAAAAKTADSDSSMDIWTTTRKGDSSSSNREFYFPGPQISLYDSISIDSLSSERY